MAFWGFGDYGTLLSISKVVPKALVPSISLQVRDGTGKKIPFFLVDSIAAGQFKKSLRPTQYGDPK